MGTRIYIFGTGAHARKVSHYICAKGWRLVGFVDENNVQIDNFNSMPLIHSIEEMGKPGDRADAVFVAIGRAEVRKRLMGTLSLGGWMIPAVIHPNAYVAPDATIEDGVLIAAGVVVESGSVVGMGAILDVGVIVDHDVRIAPYTHIRAPGALGPGGDQILQNCL